MPIQRILVVEDFEPFRKFIISILRNRSEFKIVGEESDGLAALRTAGELQPNLMVLDIGLPKLNGIEVARKIRTIAPNTAILFVSNEVSMDVVLETIHSGGLGYVQKTRANKELLIAVDSVLQGVQFIGGGLKTSEVSESPCNGPKQFRNCV